MTLLDRVRETMDQAALDIIIDELTPVTAQLLKPLLIAERTPPTLNSPPEAIGTSDGNISYVLRKIDERFTSK